MDLRSGTVRRLTTTVDYDRSPAWAPDGALIAFVRQYRALRPARLCWVTPDGRVEHCIESPRHEPAEIVGWLDSRRVLFSVAETDDLGLFRWDVLTNQIEPVLAGGAGAAVLSPDGQWVACLCSGPAGAKTWLVFPIDDPGAARVIDVDGVRTVSWRQPRPDPNPTLTIRIERRRLELALGSGQQVAAEISDGRGDPVPVPAEALRWSTADPATAQVDSVSGRVRGLRLGRTVLRVDLAGLVQDSVEVMVVADSAVTLLEERWTALDTTRWLPFGSPRPHLDQGPGGIVGLNNGGDGSYPSGLASAGLQDVRRGLGVEAIVSTPVTRSQSQRLTLSLNSSRGWPIEGWDRVTGTPVAGVRGYEVCQAAYPAGEGMAAVGRVALSAGGQPAGFSADSTWRSGAWHRIRIQLFPDGECGIAIDGVPVWRSSVRLPIDQPYRILIIGNSVDTKVLVGPLQVWRGVRKDIDWAVADTGRVGARKK